MPTFNIAHFLSTLGVNSATTEQFVAWFRLRQSSAYVGQIEHILRVLCHAGVQQVWLAAPEGWVAGNDESKCWNEGSEVVRGVWDWHHDIDLSIIASAAPSLLNANPSQMRQSHGVDLIMASQFVAPRAHDALLEFLTTARNGRTIPTIWISLQ